VRLLIVEDDDIVADAITRGLAAANYSVLRVSSAEAAHAALVEEEFAMAVIDVGLPGADGLTFVRRLRSAGKSLPTLILTARCTLTDKVKALDLGADDFLSKPFEGAELAARCRALMRREVELTAREWSVLECLVRHVGLIVSKERLQQAVADPDHDVTPNAVEVHVSRLRAKLGQAAVIRSLRGLGYRLEEAKPA
jgi:DNA-binding response OmpR family regulator